MREQRSASQVLFGALPDQTVDIRSGVWRVGRWKNLVKTKLFGAVCMRRYFCAQGMGDQLGAQT